MRQTKFPPGWNEKRIKKLLAYYENQSEEEAVAEDEAAFEKYAQMVMEITKQRDIVLVPKL